MLEFNNPFRNFCMQIGNLPASYVESTSYQELLYWLCNFLEKEVIPTVNEDITKVQELEALIQQLQEYMDNYFNNLDVQEEINNKLDEMAQNGFFASIFNDYLTIFNNKLNQQDKKIDSLVNITPLVANSISEMVDTSRIYVNTEDGFWYYFNGTSWIKTLKYNSEGISDNSVIPSYLSFSVRNYEQLFNSDNSPVLKLAPNLGTSKINNNDQSSCIVLKISPDTDYTVSRPSRGNKFCIFTTEVYPANNVDIIDVVGNTANTTNTSYTIHSSNNANYLVVFYHNSNADTVSEASIRNKLMISQGTVVLPFKKYCELDINSVLKDSNIQPNKLVNKFISIYEGYISIDFENSLLSINASFLNNNNKQALTIDSNAIKNFEIPQYAIRHLTATIENNTIISFQLEHYQELNTNNYIILSLMPNRKLVWSPVFYPSSQLKVRNYNAENILSGKKMGAIGDSLIAGSNLGNEYTALYKIAQNNNMNYVNYGINGNPISQPSNYSGSGMCNRFSEMDSDLDYVVVLGGANDLRLNVPIGENSDNVETTFKGALNILIRGLLTKYPAKKILFLTNYHRKAGTNSLGLTEIDYVDAMIEICSLYSIPCFDNYRKCGISWKTDIQTAWCDEGVYQGNAINRHFSPAGYDFLVPIYENLLKSL